MLRFEFGERMRYLLDLFDSRPDAAAVAGVTPEHPASYINGKVKPPFSLVARLAQAKGISLEWVASGEGKPALSEVAEGYAELRVLEAESSSGPGTYALADDVREHLAFSRAWLKTVVRAPEDRLCVVINRGIENLPDIGDGDALLVVQGLERVESDGWYIFDMDGRLTTRFVRRQMDKRVALFTRRSESAPEYMSFDDAGMRIFGRVRWRGGIV